MVKSNQESVKAETITKPIPDENAAGKETEQVIEQLILTEEEKQKLVRSEKRLFGLKKFFAWAASLILWIVVLGWIGAVVYDYFQVSSGKSPVFYLKKVSKTCISHQDQGKITTFTGLGYKAIIPDPSCITIDRNSKQFGPLWIKDEFIKAYK